MTTQTAAPAPTLQPCYFAFTGCTGMVPVPAGGRSVGNLCPACCDEFRVGPSAGYPSAPVEPARVAETHGVPNRA